MARTISVMLLVAVGVMGCENEPVKHHKKPAAATPTAPPGVEIDSAKMALYQPLPDSAPASGPPASDDLVSLGRQLYFDARLSKGQDLACSTCHDLEKSGADGTDFSLGHGKKKLLRNTPSVLDAAVETMLFWDGRAETIEAATRDTLLDAAMMGQPGEARIVETLKSIPAYADAFKKAFPEAADPVTLDGTVKAIGAFSRKLMTPTRWDKFAKGDKTALTDDEKKGFLKFVEVGCPTCHTGPDVGGNMLQKLGKEKPWPNQADKGRSGVTKSPSDDMMFKVSSLRNVERTAPYFHDATGKTLEEAIKTMATHQLAKDLGDEDVKSIAAFLKTLTGDLPADLAKKPEPFASTPKTPKPAK
jgi:cytochrome c peroxidase